MKPTRTLTLRRETLAELTGAELSAVIGGETRICLPPTMTGCPNYYCTGTC